ncbi:basic helix-loop-helix domain-containing protein USF3 [Polypterus senegalus]|uniref:basic helix-loop-helix domain-containing protein USF3 n=1 Tax=Polypterus senegalus TaxID=55291 RepID=UPI0019658555|nr:basic helix-loop-helix domain-containing protein USF3 [Polypterus senegalus]
MPEMTENHTPASKSHRKKNRETHNAVERHRKKKINAGITRIGELIPCSPALKQSKNMILDQAFNYITYLKRQNDELLFNGGNKEQAEEIKKLRKQREELRKENAHYIELLKANGINFLDDPTVHWKRKIKRAKVAMVSPAHQVQESIIVYPNSSRVNTNAQELPVQNIGFNIGHSVPKQPEASTPSSSTCSVFPGSLPKVCWTGTLLQKSNTQDVPCTRTFSIASGGQLSPTAVQNAQQLPVTVSCTNVQNSILGTLVQSEPSISTNSSNPAQTKTQPPIPASGSTLKVISIQPQQGSLPFFQENCPTPQEKVMQPILKVLPLRTSVCTVPVESPAQVTMSACTLPYFSTTSSFSSPSALNKDPNNVVALNRMISSANTQTTWTTLHLAGNTVQPLNHMSSGILPTSGNETTNTATGNNKTVLNGNYVATPECSTASQRTSIQTTAASLPTVQPLPIQSVLPQPQAAVLSLVQGMQVVQVTNSVNTTVSQPVNNPNVVILQPANGGSAPAIVREAVSNQTPCPQIVIIQAANPNPVLSTPLSNISPASVPFVNPVVTSCSLAQTSSVQTVGGKQLVYILPRPLGAAGAQTLSQNQTISVNGQMFALQPLKPSHGISNHVQFIQPTTCEDPKTNVALNTFGAISNLNQSILQMVSHNTTTAQTSNSSSSSLVVTGMPPSCNISVSNTTGTLSICPKSNAKKNSVKHSSPKIKKTSSKKMVSSKNPLPKQTSSSPTAPDVTAQPSMETQLQIIKVSTSLSPDHLTPSSQAFTFTSGSSPVPVTSSEQSHLVPDTTEEHAAPNVNSLNQKSSSCSHTTETITEMQSHIYAPALCEQESTSAVPAALCQKSHEPSVSTNSSASSAPASLSCMITSISELSPQVSVSCVNAPLSAVTCESSVVGNPSNGPIVVSRPEVSAAPLPAPDPQMLTTESSALTEAPSKAISQTPEHVETSFKMKDKTLAQQFSSETDGSYSLSKEHNSDITTDKQDHNQDILLIHSKENVSEQQVCTLDHEAVGSSLLINRQSDSPMSTGSGSSRSFSVASMLPSTSREDVTCVGSSTSAYSSFPFSEQADILALATTAIFCQENPNRKDTGNVTLSREGPRAQHSKLRHGSQPPKTVQEIQENIPKPPEAQTARHLPQIQLTNDKSIESVNNNSSGANLAPHTSNSEDSLSVSNLIHHSTLAQSYMVQPTGQTAIPSVNLPRPSSSSFTNQCPGPTHVVGYSHKNLGIRGQAAHNLILKQNSEHHKEANKRSPQDDLLPASKRQKPCQVKLVLDRAVENIPEHSQLMVNQQSSSSTTSVNNNHTHPDGLNSFILANSFMNSALRQSDVHCVPQASVQDPQQSQQTAGQHIQQQHPPHIGVQAPLHLHNNNLYQQPEQQQQMQGQIRERHHMYQLQQHLAQSDGQSVSQQQQHHSLHQQRTMSQEVQMQKKRGLVQASQAVPPLSLQTKQHHSGQNEQSLQQKTVGQQPQHSHHPQLHQQIQQQHFTSVLQEKSCENPSTSRSHHSAHPQNHLTQDMLHQQRQQQQPDGSSAPAQSQMQRLMTSHTVDQQMTSQPSTVSRSSEISCAPPRQERNRISSYSAEALIGKSTSSTDQRMGMSIQGPRTNQEQSDMRSYIDASRNKGIVHNIQNRISVEHTVAPDIQRVNECASFKTIGTSQHQLGSFEVQASRNSEMVVKTVSSHNRGAQSQSFRISQVAAIERQQRVPYQSAQGLQAGGGIPARENENSCHQSFMQSLLSPHLAEQISANQRISDHQRNSQCCPPVSMEYTCPPARETSHLRRENDSQNRESCEMPLSAVSSRNNSISISFSSSSTTGEIQGKNTSPNVAAQKPSSMRINDSQGNKGHLNQQVGSNMHVTTVRPVLSHSAVSHGGSEQGPSDTRPLNSSVGHRSRHPAQDNQSPKIRPTERTRSANQRQGNTFDSNHLPLPSGGSMILGRQQTAAERRGSIVRFMADSSQVSADNLATDQHTFGFPFIPEGGMNAPINANASFIPPVTQSGSTRTPAIIPVEPQNTLPSFYPPYSPAAHPSLSNDISLPYFSNQMFTSPSTEKANTGTLNNRFSSILSPPRPVGFAQPSFPLLPDMPPMPMANASGITPHLSNFNLTSLFPEIATALPPDGSTMPMSPLLSLTNAASSDTTKQSTNRPAHNISHILGHDGSSAV